MVRIRNGIGGVVALAASLLMAVTPALGQEHGGLHGGGGGHYGGGFHGYAGPHARYAVPQHWAGMRPNWGGRGPGGAWVRPWGPRWVPHYWGGGYWHGSFWPHVYLGWDFPWFLSVLPVGYSTYWWGGVPYYYDQGVYYAWSPDYGSYVVTDPPPLTGGVEEGAAAPPPAGAQPGAQPTAPPGEGAMSLFVYPKNGQSDKQTASDRFQCHQWAVGQTGYDPTSSANSSQAATATPEDYRRAITACLDARGYTVR
jgi:hypothetical protein